MLRLSGADSLTASRPNGVANRPHQNREEAVASRGFSLIELLFVVTIITILASLAIPLVQRARMTVQEKTALGTMRTISEAEFHYRVFHDTYGTLSDLISDKLVDDGLSSGVRSGYRFRIKNQDAAQFQLTAVPTTIGVSGEKGFYTDESGVIRYSDDGSEPNSSAPPVN